MKVLESRGAYPGGAAGMAVAMGFFDGVHIGHQAVISAARQYAVAHGLELAVFTYSHKGGGNRKGKLLMSSGQKYRALAELGVQYCFEPPFESFSGLAPEQFFNDMLLEEYHAKMLCCGENFAFGAKRAGSPALLRQLCDAADVALEVAPTALWKGGTVSSSRIRQALAAGDIPGVNAMLGRPFEIALPVRHGKRLGSTLGFPTLNQVFPPDMQAPAQGVYVTQTVLEGGAWPSATGYGTRPTVDGEGATCETFIPGFSGDLYGRQVGVRFFQRIADTQKFASKQELAKAVQAWAAEALAYFQQ